MRNRKLWIVGGLLLAVGAGALRWRSTPDVAEAVADDGTNKPAADFTFPDLAGKPLKLSSFKAQKKAVLVDFWATWCGPCVQDIPGLKDLETKYKNRGFTVLAVSIDDASRKEVADFARGQKINYPVVLTGGQDKIPDGYEVFGLPTAFLIDRDGIIRRTFYGPKDTAEVGAAIDKILGAAPAAPAKTRRS